VIRALAASLCLAAAPALAFDLEKWADELVKREMDGARKEKIETALKGRDPDKRLAAVEKLSYTDADELAALGMALGDPDARIRRAAASELWSAEKRAAPFRAELTRLLEDTDANVVAYAAGALQAQGIKESDLYEPRRRVLAAPEASVASRFLVSRNLVGQEPAPKLLAAVLPYLEHNARADRSRVNVELAEKALERLVVRTRDRALIEPLLQALAETQHAHVQILRALGRFEPRPEGWTRVLLGQLENPRSKARYEALSQLRSVKDEKEVLAWVPAAGAMLDDPDSSVRSEALWALASAKGLAAGEVEKVVAALRGGTPAVRRNAARALGEIAQARQPIPAATMARVATVARPALDAALQDPDKDVREEAKSALRNIGSGDAAVVAAAAPSSEGAGMALLRARKVSFEMSSFFRALSETDVELVRAFLDAGMSPSASLNDMGPPMRVMLFSGEGCSPNVRPTSGKTKAIVKLLIERGADVNGADANGNSALTEAASKGCDRELIRTLLKAGAKMNAPHASGLAPFEMGLWSGHDGLEEFLAAGYRLPPAKVKMYLEAYKDRPAAVAMVKKAAAKK